MEKHDGPFFFCFFVFKEKNSLLCFVNLKLIIYFHKDDSFVLRVF